MLNAQAGTVPLARSGQENHSSPQNTNTSLISMSSACAKSRFAETFVVAAVVVILWLSF